LKTKIRPATPHIMSSRWRARTIIGRRLPYADLRKGRPADVMLGFADQCDAEPAGMLDSLKLNPASSQIRIKSVSLPAAGNLLAGALRIGPLLVACAGVMLALAMAYVLVVPRSYTAVAQVLIDPKMSQPMHEQASDAALSIDNPQVESQLILIRSERILSAVDKDLQLSADPDFMRGLDPADNPAANAARTRAVREALLAGLEVRRSGLSHVIDISFSAHDPAKAAKLANAIADAYIRDQLTARAHAAEIATDWLERRITQLREQVNASALKVQEFRAKRDYRIPGGDVAAAPAKNPQVTIDELESTALTYKKLYESTLQAYTDSVQRQSLPASIARIISYASPPPKPSHPKTLPLLAAAIALGLGLGYAIQLLRGYVKPTVNGADQVTEAKLRFLGELGLPGDLGRRLPAAAAVAATCEPLAGEDLARLAPSRFDAAGSCIYELAGEIAHATTGRRRTVAVASISCADGSWLSASLAGVLAGAGRRVLLADAGFASPVLTHLVGAAEEAGAREVVQRGADAGSSVVTHAIGNADFLPAGARGVDFATPTAALSDLVSRLPADYDVVIVDIPFLEDQPGDTIFGAALDSVFLVARKGVTGLERLRAVERSLAVSRATIEGVLLMRPV
jgi:capsular polysaccharide biosynthesis protein/Mrp family chromosome partitioning ATPase